MLPNPAKQLNTFPVNYHVRSFITQLLYNITQNYGTRFDFNVIAIKIYTVVLVLCDLKRTRTA